ncbi:cytochrome oxidase putative small subunit CydP [Sutterella sp.]|uniref:cytochrome oxidase putative small subunit CydP n=1 Tax=Sutterella sp. TaxID=1981025 RepID=UPI0026DF867D|nr:cytochrome oxidase putative small subunit CydP [Sutterella sp.]MDO5530479.1 hypothetical protein [Sutterella sp.]
MENSASARRRPRLIVEIALFVAVKLFLIFCLWWCFFSPSHRPDVTPEKLGAVLLGETSAPAATEQQPPLK